MELAGLIVIFIGVAIALGIKDHDWGCLSAIVVMFIIGIAVWIMGIPGLIVVGVLSFIVLCICLKHK